MRVGWHSPLYEGLSMKFLLGSFVIWSIASGRFQSYLALATQPNARSTANDAKINSLGDSLGMDSLDKFVLDKTIDLFNGAGLF